MIVLDASALLALLFRERGHEQVTPVLDQALMSTVNLAEVLSRFARDGHEVSAVAAKLSATRITWVPFTDTLAQIAAALVPKVAGQGLSLGDRACLALALGHALPALTADRRWAALDLEITVRLIR